MRLMTKCEKKNRNREGLQGQTSVCGIKMKKRGVREEMTENKNRGEKEGRIKDKEEGGGGGLRWRWRRGGQGVHSGLVSQRQQNLQGLQAAFRTVIMK